MTIILFLAFAVTGAYLMHRNGLSWIEGALWGGLLTIFGIIIILFRIRSNKKKQANIVQPMTVEAPVLDSAEKIELSVYLEQQVNKQILFGLAWWTGSAVAMYFALQSTGNTVYWFGGALGALFHWYRAYKIYAVGQSAKIRVFKQNQFILITVCFIVAFGSLYKIVPEYFRIDVPTVGTCWTLTDAEMYTPVACWSGAAKVKTVSFADSSVACGTATYFEPSARETRFTCLQDLEL